AEQGEPSCADTFPYPVAKSTLSHHLRILREAGVILARKQGREYHNSLRREELNALFPGLLDAVLKAAESDETQATD
ncbi:MAG: helix-turn-helix transcriptional regulator, partial [Akkermansiaceae bacterium]|nr:helix-turn-helix transcriptional regulator [Armatimonadota bacterium]